MPRVPDVPCSNCGTLMWRGRGTAQNPICRPCRKARREAWKAEGRPCRTCGKRAATGDRPDCSPCITARQVKICSTPDCGRKVQARGLCATHWSADYRARTGYKSKPKPRVFGGTCAFCEAPFVATTRETRFCSQRCAQRDIRGWSRSKEIAHWKSPRKLRPTPRSTVNHPPRTWVSGTCPQCGEWFTCLDWVGAIYCSKRCARHAGRARRGAFAPPDTLRLAVYERDGWTCQLCGDSTSREHVSGDPFSPTLDHVIPRSLGGGDDESNLRLTHAICNSLRRDQSEVSYAAAFAVWNSRSRQEASSQG